MTYAMVLLDVVIDVLRNQEHVPEWPPDYKGNTVEAIFCDSTVSVGMLYDRLTGKFIERPEPPKPKPYEPTEGELLFMESQAALFEEMEVVKLTSMEANAEIYEAILGIGGAI